MGNEQLDELANRSWVTYPHSGREAFDHRSFARELFRLDLEAKTCGNCKYLGEPILIYNEDYTDEVPTGYFVCGLAQHVGMKTELPVNKKLKAAVIDGSGYHAALCVVEDFGCNQWTQK